jgi:hypothetical protein
MKLWFRLVLGKSGLGKREIYVLTQKKPSNSFVELALALVVLTHQ